MAQSYNFFRKDDAIMALNLTKAGEGLDKLRVLDFEGGDWGDAESIHTISVSGPLSSVSGLLNSVSGPLSSVSGLLNSVSGLLNSVSGLLNSVSGLLSSVSGPLSSRCRVHVQPTPKPTPISPTSLMNAAKNAITRARMRIYC